MESRKTQYLVRGIIVCLTVLLLAGFTRGQNDCRSSPCMNDGTCFPGPEQVGYRCRCTLEYEDPICSTLKLEARIGVSHLLEDLPVIKEIAEDLTNYQAPKPDDMTELLLYVDSPLTTFRWTLNGTTLDPATDKHLELQKFGSLLINPGSRADEGDYQAFVTNEYGTTFSRKIKLKFAVTGTFSNVSLNVSMTENEPYLLRCPPHSYSYRVVYDWTATALDGIKISNDASYAPRILMEPSGDLLFSYATRRDFTDFIFQFGGLWRPLECMMTGLRGDREFGPPVYFYLTGGVSQSPGVAPKFYTRPQGTYNVASGDQFYINCTAGGRPTPTILWYKNNVLVDRRSVLEFDPTERYNRSLRLGQLNSRTHDGDYKCVAENNQSKVETSFRINVLDKVEPLYSTMGANFDTIAGKYGESVTLFCNTTGSPTTREWFFNGVAVKSSPKLASRWSVSPSTGDLSLTNLKLEDIGFYQCVASNAISEGVTLLFLVVTGPPLPPVNISVSDCTNYTTTITWDPRLLPELQPPTGFIIESGSLYAGIEGATGTAFSKLVEIQDGAVRSHVVDNLKPFTQVFFRIRAKNVVGVGFPRKPEGRVTCRTRAAAPSKYPRDLTGSPGNSDGQLLVQWTALDPLEWNGPSCEYRVFFKLNSSNATWMNETASSCSRSEYLIRSLQLNEVYEIFLQTENTEGAGPRSPAIYSLSGQDPPREPPAQVTILRVGVGSVELGWLSVPLNDPSRTVDDYWIYAWTGPVVVDLTLDPSQEQEINIPILKIPDDAMRVQVINDTRGVVTGLAPWTSYNLVVQGYNTGGLGPQSRLLAVTTLDSKDSFYILSLRITSVDFTEDLRNKTSRRFIDLSKTLENQIASEYQSGQNMKFWFKSSDTLSFRNGSVIAEAQIGAATPNKSLVLEVLESRDSLGNFQLDQNATSIRSEPDIQNVFINTSNRVVNVSGRIVLNCTMIGGPDDLNVTWFKEAQVVGLSHRTKVESKNRFSQLTIRDVMPEDQAKYRCMASKGKQNRTASIEIFVYPVLEIQPRTVTKLMGEQVTISCIVVSGYKPGFVVWLVEITEESKLRHQGRNFTATDLQVPDGEESATRRFVCEMTEDDLLATSQVAEVTITRPAIPKCPEEHVDGVTWSATARGAVDIKPCPGGANGTTASRDCLETGDWETANFIDCSSNLFVRLGNEAETLTEGFQPTISGPALLSELVDATKPIPNDTDRPQAIYGGDLSIAVDILVKLADYNFKKGALSAESDVDNYAHVASNLLEPTNVITWRALEKLGRGRSQSLVKAMDDYGLGVAGSFTGPRKSTLVQTKNLVMRVDRADPDSPIRTSGLTLSYNQSSIHVPSEAFSSSVPSRNGTRIVSLIYQTLNDVLLLNFTEEENTDNIASNSTIVSQSVDPRPPDELRDPVRIVLQNRGVDVPPGVTPEGRCVFWRPGNNIDEPAVWKTSGCRIIASESNATRTTCECDHLTVFAAIMDPYGSSISPADKKALEIISIVGCSISLLAVLITIAVTLFFWKALKSPRAKVLLNLCIAIAITCVLVISEGSARDDKAGCTVVAALLHYFLLALFSWMLCEGVLLYFLLIKVFGGGAEDKVKYFYMFGWGFPAVVVAISLGATQAEGYGTADVCWLDVPSGLIWAFIAPALIVILVNIVVFILVIRQMMGTRHVQNKSQIDKVKAGVKATAVILPLLGITWLFGLLAFSTATIAFKYIFAIFNSLQGLMIFVFHCVLNKQVKDAIKRRREKGSTGVSSNPKSKPSPNLKAKHFVGTKDNVVGGEKKRSNKAQNVYEMDESVHGRKGGTLESMVPNSLSETPTTVQGTDVVATQPSQETKVALGDSSDDVLVLFENDHKPRSVDDFPVQTKYGDSPGRKTSTALLLPLETQDGLREPVRIPEEDQGSVHGMSNHEPSPEEEIKQADEVLPRRETSSSSSSSSESSDAESEEISVKIIPDHEFPQEAICFVEDAPAEADLGALPTNSEEPSIGSSAKAVQPTAADDDVEFDKDFEEKMRKRRTKVDTMQRAGEALSSSIKNDRPPASPTQRAWQEIRRKMNRGSSKLNKHGGEQEESRQQGELGDVEYV